MTTLISSLAYFRAQYDQRDSGALGINGFLQLFIRIGRCQKYTVCFKILTLYNDLFLKVFVFWKNLKVLQEVERLDNCRCVSNDWESIPGYILGGCGMRVHCVQLSYFEETPLPVLQLVSEACHFGAPGGLWK